ncbi:MAG: hypothetical protein Kow0081_0920 [Candidatus Dojkabacteria bacterium]
MANLINILIPKVNAQADATAQPTFGLINVGGGNALTGQVLLSSSNTAPKVGERFKVRVKIDTQDVQIIEYRIAIEFDSTKLQVVDANQQVNGVQVSFLDDVFEVEDVSTDNLTNNNIGTIFVKAKSGDPLTLNKDVIEIEFQAQAVGSSVIRIQEGTTGTQLIRQAGQGLVYTSNEVTIDITTAQTQNPDTQSPVTQTPVIENPVTQNPGTQSPPPVTQIPATALSPEIVAMLPVLAGLLLVALGFGLAKSKEEKQGN